MVRDSYKARAAHPGLVGLRLRLTRPTATWRRASLSRWFTQGWAKPPHHTRASHPGKRVPIRFSCFRRVL